MNLSVLQHLQRLPIFFLALTNITANAASDCYSQGRIPVEKRVVNAINVVLLDETTVFDANMQKHIRQRLEPLVAYGVDFRVIGFSAFLDGRYAYPAYQTKIAAPLDEKTRVEMRKNHLKDFDTCQQVALIKARKDLGVALDDYFAKSTSQLAKSDIIGTLKEIADSNVLGAKGKLKRLVLVSDMLENSDITSFYANQAPRSIDAAKELQKVESKQLIADFKGASVYIIGAGTFPEIRNVGQRGSKSYRSTSVMIPLQEFWAMYFEKSGAKVKGFGRPTLIEEIGVSP
jgi:hypothetical protein